MGFWLNGFGFFDLKFLVGVVLYCFGGVLIVLFGLWVGNEIFFLVFLLLLFVVF